MSAFSIDTANLNFDKLSISLAKNEIKSNRLRLLLRLAVAVRGGMTPADFLEVLAETEAHHGREGHAKVYKLIEARLRSGEYTVHEALQEITTNDDRCFLYAEEKVKDLSTLLQMAYDTANRRKQIVAAVSKPFFLPTYFFAMGLGLLILGGVVMLPNFVSLMPVAQWEMPSQVVYYIGQLLIKYGIFVFLTLGILVAWIIWSMPNLHNKFRTDYLDRVFPWSIYKTLQSSSFILNMAAMFRAKVPILDAVRGYASVSSPYAAHWAGLMRIRLESEQTASDMRALDVGFIDVNTMDAMKILNNKLPADVVIQTIGEAEFALLADSVEVSSKRIARFVTVIVACFLLFSLYGTMSVVPQFTEKMMNSGQRK